MQGDRGHERESRDEGLAGGCHTSSKTNECLLSSFAIAVKMTNLQYTHPRNYGKDSRHCRVCHTTRGLIRKYHLDMCRRCFRERATQIGFVKVRSPA